MSWYSGYSGENKCSVFITVKNGPLGKFGPVIVNHQNNIENRNFCAPNAGSTVKTFDKFKDKIFTKV